ncbi:hypothetical protein NC651_020247 [Populus alba x Populus x berolinensis]|nr:hypothetical protein NC651_020247 [Populus alba x Populus x berolinensis]
MQWPGMQGYISNNRRSLRGKLIKILNMVDWGGSQNEKDSSGTMFHLEAQHIVWRPTRGAFWYPASAGRNIDEVVRGLRLPREVIKEQELATPQIGSQVKMSSSPPSVSAEEAKKLFPQGFKTVGTFHPIKDTSASPMLIILEYDKRTSFSTAR